jgi:hypothetical protein
MVAACLVMGLGLGSMHLYDQRATAALVEYLEGMEQATADALWMEQLLEG